MNRKIQVASTKDGKKIVRRVAKYFDGYLVDNGHKAIEVNGYETISLYRESIGSRKFNYYLTISNSYDKNGDEIRKYIEEKFKNLLIFQGKVVKFNPIKHINI
jgi:deoxyribodipyrimidine photolyase